MLDNHESDQIDSEESPIIKRNKRHYTRIPQELRDQIIHARVVQKLPIQQVAERFNTKLCTCKSILQTYEQEGRSAKKTSRRDRMQIEHIIRICIEDPLERSNSMSYLNVKKSKMYIENKQMSLQEEQRLRENLFAEVSSQLDQLKKECQHQQQILPLDNHSRVNSPELVVTGLNQGIQVITQQLRHQPLNIIGKEQYNNNHNIQQDPQNQGLPLANHQIVDKRYQEIKEFINLVETKQQETNISQQIDYLTEQTVMHSMYKQQLTGQVEQVQQLAQSISKSIMAYIGVLNN